MLLKLNSANAALLALLVLTACSGGGDSGSAVTHMLTASVAGAGTVASTPGGISCPGDCSEAYDAGATVTLTATPAAGQRFDGWGGACSAAASCVVAMNSAASVTATFSPSSAPNLNALAVTRVGEGSVNSSPAGIDCPEDCSEDYAPGTAVTLTATPAAGQRFDGWSGGCGGTASCVVNMNSVQSVAATFSPIAQALAIALEGEGRVTSQPPGIDCGSACSGLFPQGSTVMLVAAPMADAEFTGWDGGGCIGTGSCAVTLAAAATVAAKFRRPARNLTTVVAGSGTVTVGTGAPCAANCTTSYPRGSTLTLSAQPAAAQQFSGWSGGGCSGTGSCVLNLLDNTTVTATFAAVPPNQHALNVAIVGSGGASGSVSSAPAGITCGADCSEAYAQGTVVILTASAAANASFTGWSGGGCTGTSTCTVTMNASTTVSAGFAPITQLLNVAKTGNGRVLSSPAGVDCGADCSEAYAQGTSVTLSASADPNWSFTGWTGACSGSASCTVSMSAARNVTATFAPVTQLLSVTLAGGGSGTVTSTPAGINCGADCGESYAQGTSVSLTASPAAGAYFVGWSGGGCSGTAGCFVTMNAPATVSAVFEPITQLLSVTKTGNGRVVSSPAGVDCGADCSEAYTLGTSVTLNATADPNWVFAGWGGACSGSSTCVVSMSVARNVSADFTPVPPPTQLLSVALSGSGTVTSTPAGISCGADCSEAYASGTAVSLNATPAANWSFGGWSGACADSGVCSVTMSAARSVTASFNPVAAPIGLSSRPNNTSCFAFDPPAQSTAGLSLQAAFTSLPSFSFPIAMLQAPNDSSRWFIVEKRGVVQVFNNSGGVASSSVFADISGRVTTSGEEEAGLLGMAFHPNFATGSPYVYLFYSAAPNSGYRLRSTVSRFTANAGRTALDVNSEVKLIGLDKLETNHNGGQLAFGPDGYLYVGYGDGGGEPNPEAQNDAFLFGKIIRINPNGSTGAVPYSIPADNPNAGGPLCNASGRSGGGACAEVWARGFRNPWRWSFDKANGTLWVGDVGWGSFEEVNIVTRGANYGWPITEGAACVTSGCNRAGLTDPVYAVPRDDGQAITGGFVYRGAQTTDLAGQYIFGDFASKMFGAVVAGSTPGSYSARTLIQPYSGSSVNVSAFGEASDGELFALDYVGGRIHRLVFSAGSGGGVVVPSLLSATGCVSAADARLPAAGLVGYDINAPFWSDNAVKERFFAMPDAGASFAAGADGDWTMPSRGVLMKHFRLGSTLVETRLFMRQSNGDWAGYSYEWNDAQNDASLVAAAGKDKTVAGQLWHYPGRGECLQCHTAAAGFSLGLETQQLNRSFTYAQTGTNAHQLTTLSAPNIALLTPQISNPAAQPKLAEPFGGDALVDRARAYLHTNCSMCHRPGGPTPVALNLLASTALANTNTCNQDPTRGSLGLPNAKIVAPGLPDSSVLLARMNTRDPQLQMPPIASHLVDTAGVALLRQWISSISTCN